MRRPLIAVFLSGMCVLTTLLLTPVGASAAVIFVDNRQGSDAFDGSVREPTGYDTGPVKSIRRAVQIAQTGDTIILANTERPYFESVQLVGRQHSGSAIVPFTIRGNGAVIDGSRPVPSAAWRRVGEDLWKMTPWRKGHYQLILNNRPVPEHPCPAGAVSLPELPEGHWCAWRGSIYYQSARHEQPKMQPFRLAVRSAGVTLYGVRNVRIQDVSIRYFRLDGVNAHDLCENVVLDNVTLSGHGRSGVFVGGTSGVVVRECALKDNRDGDVLISELGAVQLQDTTVQQPPRLLD